MKGSSPYCFLYKTGQYGRFFVRTTEHARGHTFELWILAKDVDYDDGVMYPEENKSVQVYGVVSGQPGWTESYGWLKSGPWINDFEKLTESRRLELKAKQEAEQAMESTYAEELQKNQLAIILAYHRFRVRERQTN